MHNTLDLTNRRFGRLVAKNIVVRKGVRCWFCKCDCGGTKTIRTARLTGDRPTLSCGCLQRETVSAARTTHGRSKTTLYRVRVQIIQRCTNPKNPAYPRYGGRGIKVCDRWLNSFEDFAADVGNPPSPKHELDRFPDNNGNYEPGNIRWATKKQQARNRRSNRLVTINSETLPLAAWIERLHHKPHLIESRLRRGWDVIRALTTPSRAPH